MFRYTYAGIRIVNMPIEKEYRHMSRVMSITRAPCQRHVLNSEEKKKEHQAPFLFLKAATQLARQVHQEPKHLRGQGWELASRDFLDDHFFRYNISKFLFCA